VIEVVPVTPVETPTEEVDAISCQSARSAADAVPGLVQQVLGAAGRGPWGQERRREPRTAYPYLIRLTPVDRDGITPLSEDVVVVGKHLSPHGIDFYHHEPLPHRRVIAWLEIAGQPPRGVLVELLWCRFNKQGWYDNGGRLLRVVDAEPGALQRAAC
jgi:hypothetical protein